MLGWLEKFNYKIFFSPLYKGANASKLKSQTDPHNLFMFREKRLSSDTSSFRRHAYLSWGLSTELAGIEKTYRDDKIHLNYQNEHQIRTFKERKQQETLVSSFDFIAPTENADRANVKQHFLCVTQNQNEFFHVEKISKLSELGRFVEKLAKPKGFSTKRLSTSSDGSVVFVCAYPHVRCVF
jgi:hypothetical protein